MLSDKENNMSTSVVQDSTKAVYGMWTSYSNCPNSLNFAKLELYGHKVYFLGIQYSSNFWYPVVQLCFFLSRRSTECSSIFVPSFQLCLLRFWCLVKPTLKCLNNTYLIVASLLVIFVTSYMLKMNCTWCRHKYFFGKVFFYMKTFNETTDSQLLGMG